MEANKNYFSFNISSLLAGIFFLRMEFLRLGKVFFQFFFI